MTDSERAPETPPSRRTNLLRIGCATIIGCVALVTVGSVILWFEAQAAIDEWSDLGGTISDDGLIVPSTIDLGAAAGLSNSQDVEAICRSLRRMRRLPGCVHLNLQAFGDSAYDETAIESMLEAFRPVELTAGHVAVGDEALRMLASNGYTARVNLSSCPVTAKGLAALLDQSRIQLVRIGSNDLNISQRRQFKAKYGERIVFL